MKIEDYNEYYIQGSDHYLIPKDVFNELIYEMINWKEESQKQKEVIDKKKYLLKEQGAELKKLYSEIDKLQGRIDKLELENKVLKEQMVAMVKPNYTYGIR